jgi:glycosyltransferase involved in cell wall biosynthesis
VCEVIKTLDVGGAEVLLTERLRRSAKDSVDYTVVCMSASGPEMVERLTASGVAVIELTRYRAWTRYLRLVRTVAALRPDVVNTHSPAPAAVLRPALRLWRRRTRLVSTVHSVAFRATTMVADRLTRGLDHHTVAVSPIVARSATVAGARRLATRVHGVDTAAQRGLAARREAIRAELGVPRDAFVLAAVANFRPDKDHRTLVAAAETVLLRRPDALFVFAGSGDLRDEVAADIERRGVGGQVMLLGHVRQGNRLAAAADLLVLSSRSEGLPVAVMEALAAGVPVVATAVGGVPDLVRDGDNGLLCRPGSPGALADALLAAMEPGTYQRLRAGARDGTGLIDIAATAAWFDDLYTELAGKARA